MAAVRQLFKYIKTLSTSYTKEENVALEDFVVAFGAKETFVNEEAHFIPLFKALVRHRLLQGWVLFARFFRLTEFTGPGSVHHLLINSEFFNVLESC